MEADLRSAWFPMDGCLNSGTYDVHIEATGGVIDYSVETG